MEQETNQTDEKKIVVRIPDVLAYLKAGKSRKEIAQIYGLNSAQKAELFSHPDLKGKRVNPKPTAGMLIIEGGTQPTSPNQVQAPVASEAETTAEPETQEQRGWS